MYTSLWSTIIQNYFLTFIIFILYSGFLPVRKIWDTWWKKALALVIPAVLFAFLTVGTAWIESYIDPLITTALNLILSFGCFILTAIILLRGSISGKVTLALFAQVLFMLGGTVGFAAVEWFSPEKGGALFGDGKPLFFTMYIVQLLFCLVMALLIRTYCDKKDVSRRKKLFIPLLVMLIASVAYIFILLSINGLEGGIRLILLCTIFLLAADGIVVISFLRQQNVVTEEYESMLVVQDSQLREQYYDELELHHKEILTMRHDFKNQLLAIRENRDLFEIDDLLKSLNETGVVFTENHGLNQLILAKLNKAKEYGVQCDFTVDVPESMGFKQLDIAAIIGNIMDNAIEACQKCNGRRVFELEIIYDKHTLLIHSENTVETIPETIDTTKEDKRYHGLGLRSIKRTVEKYNGTVTWDITENLFTLDALLWEPKS